MNTNTNLIKKNHGKYVTVLDLCNEVDCDFTNQFVGKNVKDVLRNLEMAGLITVVSGRKVKSRNGILNMPDNATIYFN